MTQQNNKYKKREYTIWQHLNWVKKRMSNEEFEKYKKNLLEAYKLVRKRFRPIIIKEISMGEDRYGPYTLYLILDVDGKIRYKKYYDRV
jgi:hypothetical protein